MQRISHNNNTYIDGCGSVGAPFQIVITSKIGQTSRLRLIMKRLSRPGTLNA